MPNPTSDWISAFPADDPDEPYHGRPPVRPRTNEVRGDEDAATASANRPSGVKRLTSDKSTIPDPVDEPGEESGSKSAENEGTEATASYDVGYGKPPRDTQFKPGQSGNPKGRPKGAKGLDTLVRETLGGMVAVRTAGGTKQVSRIEAVLAKTVEQAMKGNSRAQLELMKLWKNAVPDEVADENGDAFDAEEPTAADLAALAEYRAWFQGQADEGP